MNPNILRLIEQAGLQEGHAEDCGKLYPIYLDHYGEMPHTRQWHRLVHLVAKECALISDSSFHNGSAGYTAILNHFGVPDEPTN